MSPTHEEFLAELEGLGVAAVRERITTNAYLGGLKAIAQGWVDRQHENADAEQLELARGMRHETRKSNKIAMAALFIAAISMATAVVSVALSIVALRH